MKGVVGPGKAHAVELVDFNATRPECVEMLVFEGQVVRTVAEAVEEHTHLYPFGGFAHKAGKHLLRDGVVAEVKILHVNAVLRSFEGRQ